MSILNALLVKEASEEEVANCKKLIKKYRKKYIKDPAEYVQQAFEKRRNLIEQVVVEKNISSVISTLRESAYEEYLVDEALFNYQIISEIGRSYDTPNDMIGTLIEEAKPALFNNSNPTEAIKDLCGKYASCLFNSFFYVLSLSNTNSRRSRAGQTFEQVIYKMYETFGYSFVSQKQVGAKFQEKGLGKKVDSLLPGLDEFDSLKSQTIVGTMKTTLRERWQEVIEEMANTGVPKIYLLTMDDDIAASKAKKMGEHNVIIVVPKEVKESEKLADKHNIISFEEYFINEIPPIAEYWKKNPPRKKA